MNADHSFRDVIREILGLQVFAVVGASRDREKYGYKVFKSLKRAGYTVYAINPNADDIDGDPAYPLLDNVPEKIDCIVTVVHPEVTEDILQQAGHLGVRYCWMQPGSESEPAVKEAIGLGIETVHGGPCIMVAVATHPREAAPAA
jgi:predicted CoA-binding protein